MSDLLENLNKAIQALVENGIEREIIIKNSLLTPSCGMGLMSVEDSTKALKLLAELSSVASQET